MVGLRAWVVKLAGAETARIEGKRLPLVVANAQLRTVREILATEESIWANSRLAFIWLDTYR